MWENPNFLDKNYLGKGITLYHNKINLNIRLGGKYI